MAGYQTPRNAPLNCYRPVSIATLVGLSGAEVAEIGALRAYKGQTPFTNTIGGGADRWAVVCLCRAAGLDVSEVGSEVSVWSSVESKRVSLKWYRGCYRLDGAPVICAFGVMDLVA